MPDPSAVDRSDEVSSLRAENNELRTQLADANDEIDRLKRLLHEKVIEKPPSSSPTARRNRL